MTTLAVMKSRIANEISRDDLTTEISEAIATAITAYSKERFRFSESAVPPTFNTVIGRWVYTSADNANIGTVQKIDYLFMNQGGSLIWLTVETPAEVRAYNTDGTVSGDPSSWAYEGNSLLLSPIPSAVRQITMGGHLVIAGPGTDNEANNPWMIDGEALIRARAKYELAVHMTRNAAMAAAMSPNEDAPGEAYRAFRALKREFNRVVSTGRVKAMQF